MKIKAVAMLMLLALGADALSGTAPWYRWRNQLDRTIMCAQTSPGNAWEPMDGPYMDSRCRKAGNPQ